MAENINLIPAAELPLTEAKEVEVLCVENGELKRKAAGNLGGGGGGYVIHVQAEDVSASDDNNPIITVSESRDNFAHVIESGGSIWLDLSAFYGQVMESATFIQVPVMGITYDEQQGLVMMAADLISQGTFIVICPNGTWVPGGEA